MPVAFPFSPDSLVYVATMKEVIMKAKQKGTSSQTACRTLPDFLFKGEPVISQRLKFK